MLLAGVVARTNFTHVHYTLCTHMLTHFHAPMPLHTRKHTRTHIHTNAYTPMAICVIVFYMNIISFQSLVYSELSCV